MRDNTCTHCGAPLRGNKCEYCDTVYYDIPDNSSRIRELEREIKELEFRIKQRKIIDDMIKSFNLLPDPKGGEGDGDVIRIGGGGAGRAGSVGGAGGMGYTLIDKEEDFYYY